MHQYLRAIGFSDKMTRKELDIMLKKMILENDRNDVVKQEDGSTFVEISKKFGPNIGITLCGEVDKDGFHQDYYFPYLEGEAVSTKEGLIRRRKYIFRRLRGSQSWSYTDFLSSKCGCAEKNKDAGRLQKKRTGYHIDGSFSGRKNITACVPEFYADGI